MSDLLNILLSSGLAQYPDKRLYNAATLLIPEERPTVPVEMVDNPWRAREGVNAQYFGEINKYNPDRVRIAVQKRGRAYRDDKHPRRLAAVLAHEAEHGRGQEEAAAYQKQHDVLTRLGERDQTLMKALLDRVAIERENEEKTKAPRQDLTPLQAAFQR
jgi:hypothetical protein